MASKTRKQRQQGRNSSVKTGSPQPEQSQERVLMPREYYYEKHPWFGSQIHYTIDAFRQIIRDIKTAKASRQSQ